MEENLALLQSAEKKFDNFVGGLEIIDDAISELANKKSISFGDFALCSLKVIAGTAVSKWSFEVKQNSEIKSFVFLFGIPTIDLARRLN